MQTKAKTTIGNQMNTENTQQLSAVVAQRDHLRRALEDIEASCDRPSSTWEMANSALLRLGESAKIAPESERLRAALEEIEREASGALNNAMPEDAPDILDHIHGIARRALSPNVRDEPRGK